MDPKDLLPHPVPNFWITCDTSHRPTTLVTMRFGVVVRHMCSLLDVYIRYLGFIFNFFILKRTLSVFVICLIYPTLR